MLRIQIPKAGILRAVQIPLYLIGRFWSYVERPSLKACWPWIGGRNDYGYGVFELGQYLWQLVQGGTAYARGFEFIDARTETETRFSNLLDLAKN